MKNWIIHLAISALAAFAPAKSMILASMVLVLADLITGVLASKKAGRPITSAGLRRTVSKFFIYETAILLTFLTEKYLLSSMIPVSSIVAGMIGITELKSCLENLNEISGQDLLKQAINKLGSINQ